MTEVRFDLPLRRDHRERIDNIRDLVKLLPGVPVRVDGSDEQRGSVVSALWCDGYVECRADVDDALAEAVSGYGMDAVVQRPGERLTLTKVLCVRGLPEDRMPPDAIR